MICFKYRLNLKEKNCLNIIQINVDVSLCRKEMLLEGGMNYLFRNLH